jgi:hypothetical protein
MRNLQFGVRCKLLFYFVFHLYPTEACRDHTGVLIDFEKFAECGLPQLFLLLTELLYVINDQFMSTDTSLFYIATYAVATFLLLPLTQACGPLRGKATHDAETDGEQHDCTTVPSAWMHMLITHSATQLLKSRSSFMCSTEFLVDETFRKFKAHKSRYTGKGWDLPNFLRLGYYAQKAKNFFGTLKSTLKGEECHAHTAEDVSLPAGRRRKSMLFLPCFQKVIPAGEIVMKKLRVYLEHEDFEGIVVDHNTIHQAWCLTPKHKKLVGELSSSLEELERNKNWVIFKGGDKCDSDECACKTLDLAD